MKNTISILFRQSMRNIISGALLLLPLVTTLYVFIRLIILADSMLPSIVHAVIPRIPEQWPPFLGIFLILISAYFTGLAAKNYFGRKIMELGNAIITRIPFISKVYVAVQQIVDAITLHQKKLFDKAVLIEYPKAGSYCIGFVTTRTTGEIPKKCGTRMVSIFVPTTPNPTSGFLLFLPESEVMPLDMSVEVAVKTVVSAGMVSPEQMKKTQHIYSLQAEMKGWNIFRRFGRGKGRTPDPRD